MSPSPQVKRFNKQLKTHEISGKTIVGGVQSFTLNDHIINILNHQLFEQDNWTLNPPLIYDSKFDHVVIKNETLTLLEIHTLFEPPKVKWQPCWEITSHPWWMKVITQSNDPPRAFFGLLGSQWPFPKGFQLIVYMFCFLTLCCQWWDRGG